MWGEARQSHAEGLCEQSGRQSAVDEERKRDPAHAQYGGGKTGIGAGWVGGECLSLRRV
jgi:hypothetical protein